MESLKKQRASYELALNRLAKFAKKLTVNSTESIDELRLKASRAHELLTKLGQIEAEIFAINHEEESRLMEAEDQYFSAVARFNENIRLRGVQDTTVMANNSMNATVGSARSAIKLAKLQIPPFAGDYTEWQSFFDLFSSSIHENENIPTAQKFQYLVGLLKGEAYSLVRHFKITEANYCEALQKLTQRYNRKRHTVNVFIRKFVEQPVVTAPSSDSIRKLLDTSDEVVRGLRALSEQAESRDPWLIYLILQKLDGDTKGQWAQETTPEEYPTLNMLFEFLGKRIDALESLKYDQTRPVKQAAQPKPRGAFTALTNPTCIACNISDHRLIECDKFKQLSIDERRCLLGKNKRCFNCFNSNHTVFECRSRTRCRHCSRKHHSLLHTNENLSPKSSAAVVCQSDVSRDIKPTVYCTLYNHQVKTNQSEEVAILPTAIINAIDSSGTRRLCRALLDTASQASFVTEAFVQKLGLPRSNGRTLITGIGQTGAGKSHGVAQIQLTTRFCDKPMASIKAFIISKITSSLPASPVNISQLNELKGIKFADPSFNKPATIDILLGADIIFELWEDGRQKIGNSNLVAQNTKLGWVIGGVHREDNATEQIKSFTTLLNIDETLRRFWEIEELPPSMERYTVEEEACEQWFRSTTTRTNEGRFITKLPFKTNQKKISQTYHIARSRWFAMERKFQVDDNFKKLYSEFMREYQQLGHMTEVNISSLDLQRMYILPHHGVQKESSLTTKLRVVFDASAKCHGNGSLNENLMIGPSIQSSLFNIVLRFRQHQFVLVGDIEKMYRQVSIHKDDARHQLILWRDEQQRIKPYALNTVTYGTASASFMATRCLMELAHLNRNECTETSRAIEKDIYVDDLMTGASTLQQLLRLKSSITRVLSSGGFNLRKMSSNHRLVQEEIQHHDNDHIRQLSNHDESIKLLGIAWDSTTDRFIFKADINPLKIHTKRSLLSEASRIFDPLGLISPITIRIKILFQKLWLQKLEWDDELPVETKTEWLKVRRDLSDTSKIEVQRWIATTTTVSLHGFCDASKWAYAAVLYARTQTDNGVETHLICSKSKVAPLKQVSLPRLELMGAVLLSRITKQIAGILNLDISSITLWTDSRIVLDWLSSQPRRWTTFIANRTSEIMSEHKRSYWRHVSSKDNPADYATRGKTCREISINQFWWKGPDWLSQNEEKWPNQPVIPPTTEERASSLLVHSAAIQKDSESDIVFDLTNRFSNFFKLQKTIAYIFRFVKNCRSTHAERQFGALTNSEIETASQVLYRNVQMLNFPEEYTALLNGRSIPNRSKMRALNPFLDDAQIIRVGGRLDNAALPYNAKHPVILSSKNNLSKLITYHIHHENQHPGVNLLASLVRQSHWIIRGKDVAKKVFRQCVKCLRQQPKMTQQLMGSLPQDRVQPTFPFAVVGVDFCGPFKIHAVRKRGAAPSKAYLCIFVCFTTHAIHIEICMNLTSDSFIGALKRFVSRRGLCNTIYCDNATNFVGARNSLQEVYDFLRLHSKEISDHLLKNKIEFRFIPPAAPHQGGLWESAVKSTKVHLQRTVGEHILTLEEFSTLVTQIEGVLNSRPICSSNSDELDFLTPAHILIGRHMKQVIEMPENKLSTHSRWDIVKRIHEQFWKRWKIEYLTSLQTRSKWQTKRPNLQIDDIVIIQENNLPPTQWLLGKIIQVYPGNDGNIRVVQLKTKGGVLKRSIHQVCRLPVIESDDSMRGVCPETSTSMEDKS